MNQPKETILLYLTNGNRNDTTHLQGKLEVTWLPDCGLQIPEYYLSGISVRNMAECHEVIAQMINEADVNKIIAATLRSVRAGKGANTKKFYLHNSLLPRKGQEGGFYDTATGTFKTAIVFKSVMLSEKKMWSLKNILGLNSPHCKARAAEFALGTAARHGRMQVSEYGRFNGGIRELKPPVFRWNTAE